MQVNPIDYDEMFQARKKLQAIADAWNEHTHAMGEGQFRDTYSELATLLDALTTEVPSAGTEGNKGNDE